jgi:glucoamylase
MAMRDGATALSILQYLQSTQTDSGSWPQNMFIDGTARWPFVQLDEVALPIILAWKLRGMGMTRDGFYPMVKRAAAYIATNGPATEQDRWEERAGLSPATLAAEITALICAAHWAKHMGETRESDYLFSVADYWQTRLEDWTFRQCDCLKDISGHYMQIVGEMPERLDPEDQVCHAVVFNRNRPGPYHQGAMVDAGFLDLVRYGVRGPRDPRILDSLKDVDHFLRFEFDSSVAFYRYNFDGYGEKEDGSAFDGSGVGRPWPLLTGERAVYEAIAEVSPEQYLDSLESFANDGFMFPEQVWDRNNMPRKKLQKGKGTGSATPLVWAHAEYIKALRTVKDAWGCDIVQEVKARYVDKFTKLKMTAWKKNKLISSAQADETVRIICLEPANLLWTSDNWASHTEEQMNATGLGIWHIDFAPGAFESGSVLIFTFHYPEKGGWEGVNYEITIK